MSALCRSRVDAGQRHVVMERREAPGRVRVVDDDVGEDEVEDAGVGVEHFGAEIGELDDEKAARPRCSVDRGAGVRRRGVEHDQLAGTDDRRQPPTLEVVAGARGDTDHVLADRVDSIAGRDTLHPQQALVVRRPPRPHDVDVAGHDRIAGQSQERTRPSRVPPVGSLRVITTHIIVHDAARAAEWYSSVLGAEERSRITLPDGRLIHLELAFGPSLVMVADEFPEHDALSPNTTGCTSVVLYLQATDVDALWARALDGGAQILRPLADTFWGEREGQIVDPFGHRWGLSQHIRDVPLDEMSRVAAEVFGATA